VQSGRRRKTESGIGRERSVVTLEEHCRQRIQVREDVSLTRQIYQLKVHVMSSIVRSKNKEKGDEP
jgi:hypothetical protein